MSLVSVLMLSTVLLTLGLTVVAASIHHAGLARRLSNLDHARHNAESVVSVAIERFLDDNRVGSAQNDLVELTTSPRNQAGVGRLTFRHTSPDLPYSTDNLGGDSTLIGYGGRPVPPHSAQLLGIGQCGGVTRQVEMVVSLPPFPYAIACSGPFFSDGELYLAGVEHSQDIEFGSVPDTKLLPAHLLSDGVGSKAVELGPNTLVVGDLRSAGEVVMHPNNCRVDGRLVSNGSPQTIPQLDVNSFDPAILGRTPILELPFGQVDRPGYQGFVRREGDLVITNGLVLDNGVLFVRGNLQISGGMRGVGAVLATGKVEIEGSTSLNTDDRLALVSGGKMSLRGNDADSSFFQGLVYSAGRFEASRITLVGSLIVQAGQEACVLRQSRMIRSADLTEVVVQPGGFIPLLFTASGSNISGTQVIVINVARDSNGFLLKDPDSGQLLNNLNDTQAVAEIQGILARHQMQAQGEAATLLARLSALPAADQGVVAPGPPYAINPSLFLTTEERMQVVFWQET